MTGRVSAILLILNVQSMMALRLSKAVADQYNKPYRCLSNEANPGYVTPSVSLQHLYTQFDQESADANGLDKNSKS
ncbi:MAG: hypothetical protein U1E98_03720 [Moraxella osloensis]